MGKSGIPEMLKSRKFIVMYVLIALLTAVACLVYSFVLSDSYLFYDPTSQGQGTALIAFYWIIAVLVIAGSAVIYYFSYIHKVKLHYIVMMMLLLVGLVSMFVMSPNTVADEIVHYESAYRWSNDLLGQQHTDEYGRFVMKSDDYGVIEDYSNTMDSGNYARILENITSDGADPEDWSVTGNDASINAIIGYSVSGTGLAFARGLGLSPLMTYYTGRIFNLLIFVFLVTLAVRKIPFGKVTLAAVSLLPMMMQQAASFSYDALINGLAIFFIAYCLYIAYGSAKPKWWEWCMMILAGVLIIPLKFVYVPVAGLFFLIPTKKFGSLKAKIIVYSVIIAGVAAVLAKFAIGLSGGQYLEYAGAEAYSSTYVVSHPGETAHVLLNTLNQNFMYYLSSAFCSYLGWLEVHIPEYFVIFFVIILTVSLVCNHRDTLDSRKFKVTNRIWMLVMAIVSIVVVYISLMIGWTATGEVVVQGIQGRYFLPLVPVCFLAFYQKKNSITFSRDYSVHLLFTEMLLSVLVFLLAFVCTI